MSTSSSGGAASNVDGGVRTGGIRAGMSLSRIIDGISVAAERRVSVIELPRDCNHTTWLVSRVLKSITCLEFELSRVSTSVQPVWVNETNLSG